MFFFFPFLKGNLIALVPFVYNKLFTVDFINKAVGLLGSFCGLLIWNDLHLHIKYFF